MKVSHKKEQKAQEALFRAEEYFGKDSFKFVLDGDGTSKGVLNVIKNYGGTNAANLAHYYAGVSYLHLGEFAKAVEHLKDFSSNSRAIQMVAYGATGDALSELKKNDEAIVAAFVAFEILPASAIDRAERQLFPMAR